jgi:hypothetical protein
MSVLPTLEATGAPFSSRGHFVGGRPAVVRVNALAATPYAARRASASFPVGSIIVEIHGEAAGQPAATFVMQKREAGFFDEGGDWEYTAVRADGTIEDRGRLASCARCHAEAAAGWIFGRQ